MVHHEFQSYEFQKWAMIEVKTRRRTKMADPAIEIGSIRFLIFHNLLKNAFDIGFTQNSA